MHFEGNIKSLEGVQIKASVIVNRLENGTFNKRLKE